MRHNPRRDIGRRLRGNRHRPGRLSVAAPAPDARCPGQAIRFGRIEPLPVGIADWPEDFYRLVFGVVPGHEAHEAAEFVPVDGSRLFAPLAGAGTPPRPGRS
jgi:hypothetical protein